ncbi:MAG: hypothetical protein U0359_31905 [Byssovorax sp.]
MKHPTISAVVEPRGASRLSLSFFNESEEDAYLYRPNACLEGRFDNDVLVVLDAGERVPYIGCYTKRPAPQPDDFFAIAPQSSFRVDVDVALAYKVAPQGRYTVLYQAFHDNPFNENDLWEVTSNTVAIAFE